MFRIIHIFLLIVLSSSCFGQVKDSSLIRIDSFDYSNRFAHPIAKQLLKESCFWSSSCEEGPYGSDDGSDAFHGYMNYRKSGGTSGFEYLKELLKSWDLPYFNLFRTDTGTVYKFLDSSFEVDPDLIDRSISEMPVGTDTAAERTRLNKELSIMGYRYLTAYDHAIISVALAELIFEGKIEPLLKANMLNAVSRELTPRMLNNYLGNYGVERAKHLLIIRSIGFKL